MPLVDEDNRVTGVASRNEILMALQPPTRPSLLQQVDGLPHWMDLLATDLEPALAEQISSVAKGRLISVAPTSRLADTLSKLTETGRDVVLVQENGQLLGTVSLTDIVRVFPTLMRLQTIKGN